MVQSLEMKTKIIMNEVCMIFIGIHINMKLKYKKKFVRHTAGQIPTKIWKYKPYSLVNGMKKRNWMKLKN